MVAHVGAPPPPIPSEPEPSTTGVERPAIDDPREKDIAAELRRRYSEAQAADGEWLNNARFELDFLDNHWLVEENGRMADRDLQAIGRSAFNIDLLNPAIDVTVNQARINKITATFIPLSEGANEATAEVRQGLYRNIERVSKAAIARETAYQLAVSVGRAYYRIIIEDEDGPTFQKRIGVQRVDNLNSVVIDPTCLDFNYADAQWAYCFDDLWKEEFRATYQVDPDSPLDLFGHDLASEEVRNLWFPKDKVRVGEYFRKVWKKRTVLRIEDGTPSGRECWADQAPQGYRLLDDGRPNVKEKTDYVIEWRKMTGTQTLEKRIWPGRFIPIVVMIGREVFRGRRPKIHRGMIRPAIDPSRIHDAAFSRMLDEVFLSPLPHMMSAKGQLSPEQQRVVASINRNTWATVEYDPTIVDPQRRALPPPHWEAPSANTAATVQAAELASQKLDRVLNTYAPNRGQAIADQSGRAIREIKDSGDMAHAAFPDNLNRALMHEALIINDLMDTVYTDAQAITITQVDEKTKQVLINQEYVDQKTGNTVKHVFGSEKYGVVIQPGPSYPSRQAEAAQKLLDFGKIIGPGPLANILDLLIQDLNVPNAAKYKERLRPPGFHDDEDGPSNMELQQQVQQLQGVNDQAHGLIQKLLQKVDELGAAETSKALDRASKERIAAAGNLTTIMAVDVKQSGDANHAALMAQLESILKELDAGHDQAAMGVQAGHDQNMERLKAGLQPPANGNGAPQPPAAVPGGVPVTAPDGSVHTFPHQQAANSFKQAIGVQ